MLHPDVVAQSPDDADTLEAAEEEIRNLNKAYEAVRKLIVASY
jgi:hypothetical protein